MTVGFLPIPFDDRLARLDTHRERRSRSSGLFLRDSNAAATATFRTIQVPTMMITAMAEFICNER